LELPYITITPFPPHKRKKDADFSASFFGTNSLAFFRKPWWLGFLSKALVAWLSFESPGGLAFFRKPWWLGFLSKALD